MYIKDVAVSKTNNMTKWIEVAPNIFQTEEEVEANMQFDEARDEEVMDELN